MCVLRYPIDPPVKGPTKSVFCHCVHAQRWTKKNDICHVDPNNQLTPCSCPSSLCPVRIDAASPRVHVHTSVGVFGSTIPKHGRIFIYLSVLSDIHFRK